MTFKYDESESIESSMAFAISSSSNPRIKALAELRRKGVRADPTRVLIDGVRELERATHAGAHVEAVYYCTAFLPDQCLPRLLKGAQAEVTEVTEGVFEKIRYGDRTGGIVAVAVRPQRTLQDIPVKASLLAVVEGIGKPGNLGGILRSADGAGVEALLVADSPIDVYGPNVIRASVAAVFRLPVVESTAGETREYLNQGGFQIVAASPQGQSVYTEFDFRGPTAFVFGAEDKGLSSQWRDVRAARVPMQGMGDSLNVSTTAALFFYEALRQRNA